MCAKALRAKRQPQGGEEGEEGRRLLWRPPASSLSPGPALWPPAGGWALGWPGFGSQKARGRMCLEASV